MKCELCVRTDEHVHEITRDGVTYRYPSLEFERRREEMRKERAPDDGKPDVVYTLGIEGIPEAFGSRAGLHLEMAEKQAGKAAEYGALAGADVTGVDPIGGKR